MADEQSSHYKELELEAKNTEEDLYALLGVEFESTHAEIKRQYRKKSILYHPDKNPDPAATDRFHLLGRARDILLDEKLKSLYDTARVRRKEKALRDELVSGKRRRAKEDLERREAAAATSKRKMGDDELEKVRIAADIQRRREALAERRRKAAEEDEARYRTQKAAHTPSPATTPLPDYGHQPATGRPSLKTLDLWEKTMMRLKVAEKERLQRLMGQEAANRDTPGTPNKPSHASAHTPDLHDITVSRLKQAEKKRLEDEIRRQDEEAAEPMEM